MDETEIFLEEARELLEDVETTLLQLNEAPDDKELLNKLFRDFHTIKGSGAMFGFQEVADFTHKIETFIDSLRKGDCAYSIELTDSFLAGRDQILQMIENPGAGAKEEAELEKSNILLQIAIILSGESVKEEEVPEIRPEQLKILIVEDEFTSRFILQNFLSEYGTPHVAVDGYEAISAIKKAIAENNPYTLVCLDIKMPGIDGKKVSEEIKRLEKETCITCEPSKIVMVSSIDDQGTIDQMLSNKYCDLYLKKPVSIRQLAQFIHKEF